MKVKEYRMTEEGDFDILFSFSHEEMKFIGRDSMYHFKGTYDFMRSMISEFQRHFDIVIEKIERTG